MMRTRIPPTMGDDTKGPSYTEEGGGGGNANDATESPLSTHPATTHYVFCQ